MKLLNNYTKLILALALLVVTLPQMGMCAKAKTKAVNKVVTPKPPSHDAAIYLAPMNAALLNNDQGTLEVQFALDYSFTNTVRPQVSGCIPFVFLKIYGWDAAPNEGAAADEPYISVLLSQSAGVNNLYFYNSDYYSPIPDRPTARPRSVGWTFKQGKGPWLMRGEWHSLAVTWGRTNDGLRVEFFMDGVSFMRDSSLTARETATRAYDHRDIMAIGNESLSPVTILAYRLSNRERTSAEIALDKPLVVDEATTFLLNADSAAKIKTMKADEYELCVHRNSLVIKQPYFAGTLKIVPAPKGKAIQFFSVRSE